MSEDQRGFDFAARLHALCREHGPADFSQTSKDQLFDYLLENAVEWVKAHNRLTRPTAARGKPS